MALSSAACSMWQSPVPPPSAAHLQFDRAVIGLAMVQGSTTTENQDSIGAECFIKPACCRAMRHGSRVEVETSARSTLTDTSDFEVYVTKSLFAIIALAMALSANSVRAQTYDPRYPVCMQVFGELEGERMDCIFTSLAQCQASASGRPAVCLINPYFAPAPAPGRRRR